MARKRTVYSEQARMSAGREFQIVGAATRKRQKATNTAIVTTEDE